MRLKNKYKSEQKFICYDLPSVHRDLSHVLHLLVYHNEEGGHTLLVQTEEDTHNEVAFQAEVKGHTK